jgi:succinoglycan biosynthesis transport protein ExoP
MTKFTVVQEGPESDERLIDPRAIWLVVQRRLRPILLTMFAVLLVTAILYVTAGREYIATGRLALEKQPDQLVESGPTDKPVSTDSSAVETEVQVLQSPEIAAAVVDKLQLANVPGFGVPEGTTGTVEGSRDRAIRALQNALEVGREGSSYAISVSFSSSDPVMAAKVVNAVIDAYTGGQRTSEYAQRTREIQLLRDRLGLLRADVIRAEQAIAQHRGATNLVDLSQNSDAAQTAMQQLNTQLAQARADEAAAIARANAAATGNSIESPTVNALRQEQAQLRAKQAELSKKYSSNYPTVVAVNEQLSSVEQALNTEIARVRQGAVAEAQVARNRAASLRSSVSHEQGQLMAANNVSVVIAELQRNADAAKSLYQALLDEYKQKLVALGTEQSKAYVIAYAAPPGMPASPNSIAYIIGGLVAAMVLGAFVAIALETMEAGVLSQSMVERELGVPAIASIPDVATVKDTPLKGADPGEISDHMLEHPNSVFTESVRSLRTALKLGQDGQLARTLAITSALTDEGKTTTGICLARSAAAAGTRVILVDCDLRHRSATDALAPQSRVGLVEVLQDRARLEEAVVIDSATGARTLPVGGSNASGAELLTSRSMRALLARLRGTYDLVILETAPVLPVAETRAIAAMADATVLVVRWRKTPLGVIKKAVNQLDRAGAKVIGAVLARVSLKSSIASTSGEYVYYYPSARPKAA